MLSERKHGESFISRLAPLEQRARQSGERGQQILQRQIDRVGDRIEQTRQQKAQLPRDWLSDVEAI